MSRCDVFVVGVGVVGAAVAHALARPGRSVTVLEQGAPGGAVSGGSLACLGTHMLDEEELPFLIWCREAWAALADRAPGFEYRRCGQIRFLEGEPDIAAARHWLATEEAQGLRPLLLEPEAVRRVEPLLTGPIAAATWSPDDAVVNPFLAVRTLLRAARDAGATLASHTPVVAIETEGGRVCGVRTAAGERIGADAVVLAGGPWTARLAAGLGLALPIVPRKAQCLATMAVPPSIRTVVGGAKSDGGVDAGYTQIQQAASGPVLFNTVLSGGISEDGDPDVTPEVDRAFVHSSVAMLLHLFPSLAGVSLLRSWVRYEGVTPDDRFLAGEAGPAGLHIAAGDGGTGFVRAPGIARILADRMDGRDSPFRTDLYAPARFVPARAAA